MWVTVITILHSCGGHTHLKMHVLKWSMVSQGKRIGMCLTSRSLILRLVPLLLSRIIRFQLRSKKIFLQGLKSPFSIKVENKQLYPIKEGPTLKPNSSKLGTCQDQNSFTLAYQTPFQNMCFQTCVASPSALAGSVPFPNMGASLA